MINGVLQALLSYQRLIARRPGLITRLTLQPLHQHQILDRIVKLSGDDECIIEYAKHLFSSNSSDTIQSGELCDDHADQFLVNPYETGVK